MFPPWNEGYDKCRQHIKKQRHQFADKCLYSQSYSFSSRHVWAWELGHKEGWAPNNWCFQIPVLEKTESSWTARRSNQSILKEINLEYSLEVQLLKLKLLLWPCKKPTHWKKTLMLGEIEGKGRKRRQRVICLDSIPGSIRMNLSKLQETVNDRGVWHAAVPGATESDMTEWLNNSSKCREAILSTHSR